jgi:hypothetical protein
VPVVVKPPARKTITQLDAPTPFALMSLTGSAEKQFKDDRLAALLIIGRLSCHRVGRVNYIRRRTTSTSVAERSVRAVMVGSACHRAK